MRMRRKKHADERLAKCGEYVLSCEGEPLSNPALQVFDRPDAPVFLEIGAGKGGFACGMVRQNPEAVYIAMERVRDCVVLAAELAEREQVGDRLRFLIDTADNLTSIFAEGTVDRIFLNFSDPWSKKGYSKRRLTHQRYLTVDLRLLKDGGRITFKTDNTGLFDFTLEQLELMGIVPDRLTRDLHASEWSCGNVVTEYEANFTAMGVKINMLSFTKPDGFDMPVSEELLPGRKRYAPKQRSEE